MISSFDDLVFAFLLVGALHSDQHRPGAKMIGADHSLHLKDPADPHPSIEAQIYFKTNFSWAIYLVRRNQRKRTDFTLLGGWARLGFAGHRLMEQEPSARKRSTIQPSSRSPNLIKSTATPDFDHGEFSGFCCSSWAATTAALPMTRNGRTSTPDEKFTSTAAHSDA
jgi:hypothetical protein